MKKIVIATGVLLLIIFRIAGFAQKFIEKSSDGNIRVSPKKELVWEKTNIVITKEAEKYLPFVKKAIENKGEKISVGKNKKVFVEMDRLFYVKFIESHSQGIIYKNNIIDVTGHYNENPSSKFAVFMIFVIISIIFMIISNLLFKMENLALAAAALAAAVITFAVTLGVTIILAVTLGISLASTTATLASIAIAFAVTLGITIALVFPALVDKENKKIYWIFSAIYYLVIIIFFICIYYP